MKKVNFQIFNHLFIFSLLLLSLSQELKAQEYELGGGIGVAAYSGDIIRKIDLGQLGPQVTLFGKRNFDNVWTLRVGISSGILQAADSIKPIDRLARVRDARFRGGIIEGSAVMEFNFLDFLRTGSEFRFSPYAFFGIGYSFFTAKGNTFTFNKSTKYSLGTFTLPFGGGVKYRLNDRWTLASEIGFRPTLTDYLDKIDSKQPPIPRFVNPSNQAEPYGINFGNPNDKDWYYFFGVTISYTFATTRCYAY
ncbi:type IX secretion system protein PorG [Algoriphagus marinus]|uniref:type IX secretion system protein PorG n=1 Tax=Algoriphagus marinus TaxID=1925762 RepID=UPI00094B8707|nr:DUF6089 family protein [Algoriphagus marinus]